MNMALDMLRTFTRGYCHVGQSAVFLSEDVEALASEPPVATA